MVSDPASALSAPEGGWSSSLAAFLVRLDRVRRGFLWVLAAVAAGTTVCWGLSAELYELLAWPLTSRLAARGTDPRLAFTGLTDPFVVYFTVSLVGGLVVATPVLMAQIWRLVGSPRPRRGLAAAAFVLAATALFLAGLAFGHLVLLPFVVDYLLEVGGEFEQFITVRQYLGFAVRLLLVMGLGAQLPLVTSALARSGLIAASTLWRGFPYAVLLAFLVAALITPPDGISQLLVGVPLSLLYLLGAAVASLVGRRR